CSTCPSGFEIMAGKRVCALFMVAWVVQMDHIGYGFWERDYRTRSRHSATPSGPIKEGLRLSAQVENSFVRSGEPIILNLTLTNTSSQKRIVFISRSEYDYKADVINEMGQRVPLTKRVEELLANPRSYDRRIRYDLKPHEELKETLRVSDLFELKKAGT